MAASSSGLEELTLAPQLGHIFLAHDVAGSCFLCSRLTYEKRRLPLAPEGYTLEQGAEGYLYIDDGEESKWVADILQCNAWLDQAGETFFLKDDAALAARTYFSESKAMTASIPMGPTQTLVDIKMWLFRKRHGCSLWWELPGVYTACGFKMKGGSATKWVNAHLASWGRHLEQLSLTGVHLRRSKPYAASQEEVTPLQDDRVLESHTVSTMGLLALSSKLCGLAAKGGGLDDMQKPQLRTFMYAVFALMGHSGHLDIFMDAEVQFNPPAPLLGKRHVCLQIQGGRVLVDPFLDHVAGPGSAKLQETLGLRPLLHGWSRGQELHVVDLLVETAKHKKAHLLLVVVWHRLACCLSVSCI